MRLNAPLATTAACTAWPRMPFPPNAGRSAGCTLSILFSYRRHSSGGIKRRYPAKHTCVTPSDSSFSTSFSGDNPSFLSRCCLDGGYRSVGKPLSFAH